jgi:hypothetical protein
MGVADRHELVDGIGTVRYLLDLAYPLTWMDDVFSLFEHA